MHVRLVLTLSVMLACPAAGLADWDEGVMAFQMRDYKAAEREFRALVQQDPNGYRAQYMLGLTLQELQRQEDSLHHLRKAYDLSPNYVPVKIALSRAYYRMEQYGDVINLLAGIELLLMREERQSTILQMRGMALDKTGDTSGALRDFQRLAALQPEDARILHFYGSKAVAAGHLDVGILALEQAARLDPEDPSKARFYALALIKRGRTAEDAAAGKQDYLKAAEVAAQLVQADPNHANLMLKSSAELGAGEYTKAAETSKAAVSNDPGDWLAHYYLGQAYSSNKQYAEAEAPLKAALEKASPDDQKTVWKQLGLIYEKQKKSAESTAAYERAGDTGGTAGVARAGKKKKNDREKEQIEAQKRRIKEMRRETERLEKELEKLEGKK